MGVHLEPQIINVRMHVFEICKNNRDILHFVSYPYLFFIHFLKIFYSFISQRKCFFATRLYLFNFQYILFFQIIKQRVYAAFAYDYGPIAFRGYFLEYIIPRFWTFFDRVQTVIFKDSCHLAWARHDRNANRRFINITI